MLASDQHTILICNTIRETKRHHQQVGSAALWLAEIRPSLPLHFLRFSDFILAVAGGGCRRFVSSFGRPGFVAGRRSPIPSPSYPSRRAQRSPSDGCLWCGGQAAALATTRRRRWQRRCCTPSNAAVLQVACARARPPSPTLQSPLSPAPSPPPAPPKSPLGRGERACADERAGGRAGGAGGLCGAGGRGEFGLAGLKR